MNKNEFEIAKLHVSAGNFSRVLALVQHGLTMAAVVGAIFVIVSGLEVMVSHKPEALTALALVIEKLQISSILGYVVAAGTTLGWIYERNGKKRAYKDLGEARVLLERNDPYHPSSNLDQHGNTPSKG